MVTVSDDMLDRTFAALAHPTRRAILTRLARFGSASVSDLSEPFDVSMMAISKHVKVMEAAGLIRRERDGRVHRCSFDPASMDDVVGWIEMHRKFWTQQLDALADYLEGSAAAGPGGGDGGAEELPTTRGEVP